MLITLNAADATVEIAKVTFHAVTNEASMINSIIHSSNTTHSFASVQHVLSQIAAAGPALPPEISQILTTLQLYAGGIVVSLAALAGMAGGLMVVLGMREEGRKRFKAAIEGLAMTLTAPAFIFMIATIIKAFLPRTYA